MLELRQFDLQLAFSRASALRKDIENERRPVQDLAVEDAFQVAALRGRKFIVENNSIDVGFPANLGKLIGLAFAYEGSGAGSCQLLKPFADDSSSGGSGQFGKFLQGIAQLPAVPRFKLYPNEKNPIRFPILCLDESLQFVAATALTNDTRYSTPPGWQVLQQSRWRIGRQEAESR